MYQTLFQKKTVVLGCGNPLMGDDGFGPAVIAHITGKMPQTADVAFLDAGTSARDLFFDMLFSQPKTKNLIIIDAVDQKGRRAGEIFELDPGLIPENKIADYSVHQFPGNNLLTELSRTARIKVVLYAVQVDGIPDCICPGLSRAVKAAVPVMCRKIALAVSRLHPGGQPKGNLLC